VKTDNEPKEDKRSLITNAAQKLFGIYGAEKTSMREIADDLHMSKASLYYYFPDKENLYRAVLEKEQAEFLKTLEKDIRDNPDPQECLRRYALNRLSYFKYLVNLGRIGTESFSDYQPLIANSFYAFREKEKILVMEILEKGKKNGQFIMQNSYDISSLFLEILRGLRSVFFNNRKFTSINDEEYKELLKRITAATDIFIKGLMYKE
jgi:TetR/AcrR family transcriptional repressor of mexJK operon